MPRFAHQAAHLHYHSYTPPHSNPEHKMYAQRRRHTFHTYGNNEKAIEKAEIPEQHENGNVDVPDKNNDVPDENK